MLWRKLGIEPKPAALAAGVLAIIVYGSLYPFEFFNNPKPGGPLHALLATWRSPSSLGELIANILLYMPLGYFSAQCLRRLPLPARFLGATFAGFALCSAMELAQFYDCGRVTEMMDIYTNAGGALLGSLAGSFDPREFRLPLVGFMKWRPFAVLLVASWLGHRLYPFVPAFDVHKYKSALDPLFSSPKFSALVFFQQSAAWLAAAMLLETLFEGSATGDRDLLASLEKSPPRPPAALQVLRSAQRGTRSHGAANHRGPLRCARCLPRSATGGRGLLASLKKMPPRPSVVAQLQRSRGRFALLLLVPAVLLARIAIVQASLSPSEVAGGIFAALLWAFLLWRLRIRAALVLVLFLGAAITQALEPFHLSATPAAFGLIPFRSVILAPRESIAGVFLQKTFTYGALIWLMARAGYSWLAAAVLGTSLVLFLRIAQVYLPGRSAEITDAVMVVILAAVMKLMDGVPATMNHAPGSPRV